MKIWRFANPSLGAYAQASLVGSWEGRPARRIRPLAIEWEPGSDVVGDFTWPGFDSDIVVTDRVGRTLQEAEVAGFELSRIRMNENSEPQKRRSRKPVVKLPYDGPQLWDLWVDTWMSIDKEGSSVVEIEDDEGAVHYEASGIQHISTSWDASKGELVRTTVDRLPNHGVFVRGGTGIFRVRELPGWILCTDTVKRLIEHHFFTNVSWLEIGEVTPD